MDPPFSLRQLQYFVHLHEKPSFTAAAQSLGITQPALSIAISQLEAAVGADLVDRGSRPLALTEFGEVLLRSARRVLEELGDTREEISALREGRIGRLDICMAPSVTGLAVGGVLAGMAEEFPRLEIHVGRGVLPGAAQRVASGEFALFVGTIPEGFVANGLKISEITRIPLEIVAGAAHPLAGQQPASLSALARCEWIQIGDIAANLPGWRAPFVAAGLDIPRPALDIRNLTLVRDLLLSGHFVSVLPRPMVEADLAAGLLVRVHPEAVSWSLPLGTVRRDGAELPTATRIFVERLEAALLD